ncbi:MAG: DNA-binding NarL/FixJ family response regulator [Myxococcota bacterium]|jgi:DNA-binding NarL/FixJ family response regulator
MEPVPLNIGDSQALLGVLQYFDLSLVLVDGTGRVVSASNAASGLLLADDGLSVHKGRLVVRDPECAEVLERAMQMALQQDVAGMCSVDRPSGQLSYQVTVIPAPVQAPPVPAHARLVLRITDPTAENADAVRFFRDMYGLSAAEAMIAGELGQGLDVRQVANRRGTSAGTVRRQLQQVFNKVGVRRQTDLMRLLFRGSIGTL